MLVVVSRTGLAVILKLPWLLGASLFIRFRHAARNSPVVSCADATVAFALRPQGAELMLRFPHLVVAGSGVTYNVPRPAVAETDILASLRSSI